MMPFVITLIVILAAGCSLNDALTKARQKYEAGVDKVRATVGDENIKMILSQYDDDQAADLIIEQYERLSETLSDDNKAILKIPLIMVLKRIRRDLTEGSVKRYEKNYYNRACGFNAIGLRSI